MLNKLSSDVVTTIVGMAKSEKPTANEVKSNHTEVTGRGIPNSRITVIQKTPRRLDSEPLYIDVIRAIPAPNPTINEIDTDDTKVTGKGVANSKVYVKIPGKFEGHVDVNSNGDWEVNIGLLNGGQQIIAYQELPRKVNSVEVIKNVIQLPALRKSKY